MTIIRLLITFVYLWSLPLLLGMGTLLFFEKKLDYAKAWFLGIFNAYCNFCFTNPLWNYKRMD